MIPFIVGTLAMLVIVFLLGITRGRFVKQKSWVVIWFSLSVMLAGFILDFTFFPQCSLLTPRYRPRLRLCYRYRHSHLCPSAGGTEKKRLSE